MSTQFNIKAADAAAVARLQGELNLPRFVAATLVARGMTTPAAAREFLTPSLDRDWLNPYLIPGLSDVADALEACIREDKHIVVFGDFDLDGVSATAVLTRGLRDFGARVTPFIPLRFEEGYGPTPAALERLMKLNPDFVVTVDCGIAAKSEAETLAAAGIGLAITDHHEPADLVPEGVPIADPKCDPDNPSTLLAGAGVALKLVQMLGGRFGQPHRWREYTDLASLGTIADLMPMRDQNRALVTHGLERMNTSPRPCIAALLQASGAADKEITALSLSFSLIPRLNAAGRMGDAQVALDVLLSDDFEEAVQRAEILERVNDERRAKEAELALVACEQAERAYCGQRALVVAGEGWHEGVKGIVASRIVNTYGVPAILFSITDGEARGSGRSVGQVNLFKAVEAQSDLLTRFGGHGAAVGVTLPESKLPEFTERLCAYLDTLPAEDFHPRIDIDACVELGELSIEGVQELSCLAPFGQENPVPRFLARDVTLAGCRAVGAEKNHLSCKRTDGRAMVSGIMFHCSDLESLMGCDTVVNAGFGLQVDEWRGRKTVKAMLRSIAPARACAGLEACLNPDNTSFAAELYATGDAPLEEGAPLNAEAVEAFEAECEANRHAWEQRAAENPTALQDELVRALIGNAQLHNSQREVLAALGEDVSSMAIMATSRGKSLIFQVHAAKVALLKRQASLFVYPLRALIADQAFHIHETLGAFGVSSAVLTGESTPEERRRVFAGLTDGSVDIVLTTPEFLSFHAEEFARCGRIGFVVIDEAHHVGMAKAGNRPAYAALGNIIAQVGSPTLLALTATANSEVAGAITETLGLRRVLLDDTIRPNLRIDDQRNLKNRDSYLANIVSRGEKTVIYVNSREQSVALARTLRKLVPQVAPLVGFYNAGLSRADRRRVEDLFRTGAFTVLVATSAFGEGVNIPDIRHVVLYHMPFNEIEFNQMSGRAGRDGRESFIHLLFGRTDARINEGILTNITPNHDCLAQVYRELRRMQREAGSEAFTVSDAELAAAATANQHHEVCAESAACGIAVFRELGLIETHTAYLDGKTIRSVRVLEATSKAELTDSVRYREGLSERDVFHSFCDWVMRSPSDVLQRRVSGPILPTTLDVPVRVAGDASAGTGGVASTCDDASAGADASTCGDASVRVAGDALTRADVSVCTADASAGIEPFSSPAAEGTNESTN